MRLVRRKPVLLQKVLVLRMTHIRQMRVQKEDELSLFHRQVANIAITAEHSKARLSRTCRGKID